MSDYSTHDASPGVMSPFDRQDTLDELMCPCSADGMDRVRVLEETDTDGETWEVVYVSFVLLGMFVALLSERVGADMVMLTALTCFMAAGIVTIEEGLEGFSNEGLLTVLVLFVVAAGISVTGALDWYMGKVLGRPQSAASAQLRLMIPIAIISAFLNNTPVVAVMIPIVQRWGKNVGVSPQQLLIPLSFASIFGGTCTLIGTSTNLVVVGLLNANYPGEGDEIGLFALGEYGVPIAIAGLAYVLIASPFLLPGGTRGRGAAAANGSSTMPPDSDESILLGARLTKWSSAAGRSVKRSGLRDTGGLYLVSVHRAATGNVHRAVGQDFVLNVGDILYFTGLVEGFGDFSEEHGLEVVTNEVENTIQPSGAVTTAESSSPTNLSNGGVTPSASGECGFRNEPDERVRVVRFNEAGDSVHIYKDDVPENNSNEEDDGDNDPPLGVVDIQPETCGTTSESLLTADDSERLRCINRMTDSIRGMTMSPSDMLCGAGGEAQIVVLADNNDTRVVVGVNAQDRPGLLLDISRGLLHLNLQLHSTEAAVVETRSISIWRCEVLGNGVPDVEEIWSLLSSLLEDDTGMEAIKKRGLKVIRATVTKSSGLVGNTATDVDFRQTYKAAIVAVQKRKKNTPEASLSKTIFDVGDVLILQASDDSPLLIRPPLDFYKKHSSESKQKSPSRNSSAIKLFGLIGRHRNGSAGDLQKQEENTPNNVLSQSSSNLRSPTHDTNMESNDEGDFYIPAEIDGAESADVMSGNQSDLENMTEEDMMSKDIALREVWKDLQVYFHDDGENGGASGSTEGAKEFLTAMEVAPRSQHSNKTVTHAGLDKLSGVYLVSIERPIDHTTSRPSGTVVSRMRFALSDNASSTGSMDASSLRTTNEQAPLIPVGPDEPLKDGDILWFAGSASAVGDLRKIPGLKSFVNDEVEKINDKVHDRRLVQAVIARHGPLVGKTVKEVRFRTRYGAAVIAVHRDGKRVQEHPGKIKLQSGDVLLLEAGPTFIGRSVDNERSFALLSEVKDSAPPRLSLLIPALALAVAMLAVFTAGVASLLVCSLVAAIAMCIFGILSQQEARDAINWEIYITIACAFGIGTALENSGVAGGVAVALVAVGEGIGIGDAGLFGSVYFATFLISNVVTNNAAAALIFPIAMDVAEQAGIDRILMSYALMLGASASFMSPFGYTTNLLIYGPGGYKVKDFLYFGTPLQLVLWILTVILLTTKSVWYISWIVTTLVLVVVTIARTSTFFSDLVSRVSRKKSDKTDIEQ